MTEVVKRAMDQEPGSPAPTSGRSRRQKDLGKVGQESPAPKAGTVAKQEAFLEAFVEANGDLEAARQQVGLSRVALYRWLREDPEFRRRVDEYRILLAEAIEDEAIRRVMSPHGHRGSDALATVLLKGLKPHRYREEDKGNTAVQIVYVSGLRDRPRPGTGENALPDKGDD